MTSSSKKKPDAIPATGVFAKLDRALRVTSLSLGLLLLTVLMMLTVINVVVMRKLLNTPIRGAEDVLILVLILLVAVSIPLGARTGAHIEIEVVSEFLPKTVQRYLSVAMRALGSALLAVMTWRLATAGTHASRFGEVTQQLEISYEPFYYFLAICFGIYALLQVVDIFRILRDGHTDPMALIGDDEHES